MLPPHTLVEPTVRHVAGQHWLRLSLPIEWCGSTAQAEEQPAWRDRLAPFVCDLQQFLRAYSAALVAAIAFIT